MKKRCLKASALLLSVLLMSQAPMNILGATQNLEESQSEEAIDDSQESSGKSLKELWDELMVSLDNAFDTLFASDQEAIEELAPIALPVEERLMEQIYGLAKKEQQDAGVYQKEEEALVAGAYASSEDIMVMSDSNALFPMIDSGSGEVYYEGETEGAFGVGLGSGTYHYRDVRVKTGLGSALNISGQVTLYIDGNVVVEGEYSGIHIEENSSLILKGSGSLTALAGTGYAGIHVPSTSTLVIDMDGSLTAKGGNAGNGGNGSGRYGGSGGIGAGAGIGGNGGQGGQGGYANGLQESGESGGAGANGENSGKIIFLGKPNKMEVTGGVGGNGGRGADGLSGKVTPAILYMRIESGSGGGGGGGGGYPARGIGGGGAGGGGGNGGGSGNSQEGSLNSWEVALDGGNGGDGGKGYYAGGGGGGGGEGICDVFAIQYGIGGAGGAGGSKTDSSEEGENSTSKWTIYQIGKGWGGLGGKPGTYYTSNGGAAGQLGGNCGEIYRLTSAGNLPDSLIGGGGGKTDGKTAEINLIYDLRDPQVSLSFDSTITYTGQPLTPVPVVKWSGKTVISPTDYDVRYENNLNGTKKADGTEDKARVYIMGGYDRDDPINTSRLAYNSINGEFSITRAAITPSVSAVDSVTYGTSFMASIVGNPGNADVTGWAITGGSGTITEVSNGVVRVVPDKTGEITLTATVAETENYAGATAHSETISVMGKSIEAATVEVIPQQTYTGSPITPKPQVYINGEKLKQDEDYSLTYENNTNQGTATVIITGKGNYYTLKNGEPVTVIANFTIVSRNIGDEEVKASAISPLTYDGTGKKPEISLTHNGKSLIPGRDYTVEYTNHINAGTDSATVLVTGKGNYRGLRQEKFSILPASIVQTAVEVGEVAPVEFSGLKQEPGLTVTYLQGDGRRVPLAKETDYTVTYSENLLAGTASMIIQGKGNFKDSRQAAFTIAPKALSVKGDDQFLEYSAGLTNPAFTYTVTGAVSGYVPIFEGKLTRENPNNFDQGVYKITQDETDPLKLSGAAVNANYVFDRTNDYEPGYLSITTTSNITETAVLKIEKNGILTEEGPDGDEGWYRSRVYICAPAGYQISSSNSLSDTNVWSDTLSYSDGDYSKAGVSYFLKNADGAISDVKNITYKQDSLAPEGNIVAGSSAWYGFGTGISYSHYYNKKTPVTIFGSDGLSGVPMDNDDSVTETGIRYLISEDVLTTAQLQSMGDADWMTGTEFEFDYPKGIIYVEIRDRAGNKTYICSDGLIYDTQNPNLVITKQPPVNGWTDEQTPVIEGTLKDSLAGLKERYVTYEVGTEEISGLTYGFPFEIEVETGGNFIIKLPDLEDGKYQIRISAADNAGNEEAVTVPVWLDRTAPTFDFDGTGITPGAEWTNQSVTIVPAVNDAGSGVKKTEYSLDNGNTWTVYDSSFTLQTDGYFREILLRAEDKSGNQTTTLPGQLAVRRDTVSPVAPSVSVKGSASGTDTSGNRWFRGDQSPILSIGAPAYTEGEAPVKMVWKLWKEGTKEPGTWNEGLSTRLESEGTWTLVCKAADEAGNESTETRMTVRWDKTAPVFDGNGAWTVEKANTGAAAQIINTVSFGMIYQEELKITIHVEDNGGSGLSALTYALNGQAPIPVDLKSKSFNLPVGTKGTISVQAVDGAGNSAGTMLLNADGNGHLVIENTPPVIKITSENSPNEKGWYNQNVIVSVEVYDEDSGLASIMGNIGQNSINRELNQKEQIKNHRFQVELGEGEDILYSLTVTDNAGLQAGAVLTAGKGFCVDKTSPVAQMVLDIPYEEMSEYYGTPVTVVFSAADENSKVAAYSYTLDNGVTWSSRIPWPGETSPAPSVVLADDGTYEVGLKVWDNAGNETVTSKLQIVKTEGSLEEISNRIVLDRVAPDIPVFHVEPGENGALNEAGWYNGAEPVFSLNMPDGKIEGASEGCYWYVAPESSGFTSMEDRLQWNVKDGLISLPRNDWGKIAVGEDGGQSLLRGEPVEGAYDFYYLSRDAAGNESALQKETVRWDNSAPVFGTFTFTAENGDTLDGILNYLNYGNYFTSSVKVSIPVTDPVNPESDPGDQYVPIKASGIKSVTYSINGAQPQEATDEGNGIRSFLIPQDTKGKITVTAVDVADNSTSVYVLGSDGSTEWALESVLPDIGAVSASGADHTAGSDGNLWYTAPVTFTSEITDTGSGIREVNTVHKKYYQDGTRLEETVFSKTYDIGGSIFESTYTWREVSGNGEGNPYTVVLSAEDNAGNSQSRTQNFYIDLTKPKVDISLGDGDYTYPQWSKNNTLTVCASDEVSGVDGLSYTFDGGKVWSRRESYKGERKTIAVPDGAYPEGRLGVRIWDVAGNCYDTLEEGGDLRFKTDTQSPASGVLNIEPCQGGIHVTEYGEEWYNGKTGPQITIAVEPGNGDRAPVHDYWCVVPEGDPMPDVTDTNRWTKDNGDKLVLPDEGRYVVYWYVEDEAGNEQDKAKPKSQIIRYDNTKISYEDPEVTFSKVNTGTAARMGNFITGGNYFNEAVRITVYTADTGSHPAQVYYSLDLGNTWKAMKTDSQISDESRAFYFDLLTDTDGMVQVWYYAVDRAGNRENVRKLKGESGSLEWIAENRGPVISNYFYAEPVNKAGWFNQTVHVNVEITDQQSGVAVGTASCPAKQESQETILDNNIWENHNPVEKRVKLSPVIDFDCTNLALKVKASDNSGNESERTELISRDTVNPQIENIKGWPDTPVNTQPTVSFIAKDERSGIKTGNITVTKDGTLTIPVAYEVKDDWNTECSFEMAGNGHYLIAVTDTAGNTSTFERDEILIDTAGTEAAANLDVLLDPVRPDGENGWYRSAPHIEIHSPVQAGASTITTWYTLYHEGEAEPSGTLFAKTEGVGTTGTEGKEVQQPVIPADGRWKLHVWSENEFGNRTEFETLIKVDAEEPYDLTVENLPKEKAFSGAYEVWINRDKNLSARAKDKTSGVHTWCYSLDQGTNWTGWRDWSGHGSIKVDRDVTQENSILFRVKDEAGNETISSPVTVLRDTEAPWLYLALADGMNTVIGTDEPLLFYMNEEVWQLPGNKGNIRVWDYDSRSLYCVVKARDAGIDVNRHDRTVEVKLPVKLEPGTRYYVDTTPDFVTDQAGNVSGVCGGYGVWEFRTPGERKPDTVIQGFNVDLISGTPEANRVRRVEAVKEEEKGYHVIARPEYVFGMSGQGIDGADEGMDVSAGMKYTVLDIQVLTKGSKTVKLWTEDENVSVEPVEDNLFHVEIPEGTERLLLYALPDGTETETETVKLTVIQGGISARAAGDLHPKVDEAEVVNRIKLSHELDDAASRIELTLTVDRQNDSSAAAETKAAEYMLGGKLPVGSKASSLDIAMTKQLWTENGSGKHTSIHSLEGPIHVTMDLEPEFREYENLLILRLHDDEAGYIRPEKMEGGTRIQFETDRFSEYILVGSDGLLIPEQRTDGVMTISAEVEPAQPDDGGTATPLQATGSNQSLANGRWRFPWWILILSASLLAGSCLYYRNEKKQRGENDDEADDDEKDSF